METITSTVTLTPGMLAGWMTLEARLASAFVILLVFAAGMLPARRVQAAPVPAVASVQKPAPRLSQQEGRSDLLSPPRAGRFIQLSQVGGRSNLIFPVNRMETQALATEAVAPEAAEPIGELELLNQDRARAGLPALVQSPALDRVAAIRATQLITDGITHSRPGASVLAAVALMNADHISYVWHGENIIWEGGQPWSQVPAYFNDWWMASPAHRDNILNPHYHSVGIGVARNGNAVYMVEVFTD